MVPTMPRSLPARLALLAAMLALAAPAGAQTPAPGTPAKPTAGAAAKPKPAAKSDAPAAPGEGGLKSRVDQLEEQLVDMQVVIGTLESLAKSGGNGPAVAPRVAPSASMGASDSARLDGIETQIRAMTAQIEQLSDQMRALSARRSDAGPAAAPPPGKFGQTTVTADPIGGIISKEGMEPAREPPPAPIPPNAGPPPTGGYATAAAAPLPPAGADPASAKQAYETAYGYLLQQDYGAAQAAFEEFLGRYPNDTLAGNAQYWLGESFFVRGQFKQAAQAFLKGYQTYGQSAKAPDSLLKLAMSLDRLGQKDAACSSYSELNVKFPAAPAHIKSRAVSERQRIGCG
jgi:tol-pal system protein YbgF